MSKSKFFAIVLSWFTLQGCSVKTVPLTSVTSKNERTDSTSTKNTSQQSDSSYVERMIKRMLAGSQVGLSLSPGQYDSLVRALKSLPRGTNTIIKTDTKLQTQLELALDSLGNLSLRCRTLDRYYYERDVQSKKTIFKLTEELNRVHKELKESKNEVRVKKQTIWDDIKGFFKTLSGLLTIAGVLLAIGFITGFLKRKK